VVMTYTLANNRRALGDATLLQFSALKQNTLNQLESR